MPVFLLPSRRGTSSRGVLTDARRANGRKGAFSGSFYPFGRPRSVWTPRDGLGKFCAVRFGRPLKHFPCYGKVALLPGAD